MLSCILSKILHFISLFLKILHVCRCCASNIVRLFPRSNKPARKPPVPNNSGDFVEAVFRPEIFRIFSDDFRPVPAGKHRKLTGIHRKKSGQIPVGILLPCSSDFRCFPAGSGGRNHRSGFCYNVILVMNLTDINDTVSLF